jgi:hypothetical protein
MSAFDAEKLVVTADMRRTAAVRTACDEWRIRRRSAEECNKFPRPQVRAALVDPVRIGQALQAGLFLPSSNRAEPYPRRRRKENVE